MDGLVGHVQRHLLCACCPAPTTCTTTMSNRDTKIRYMWLTSREDHGGRKVLRKLRVERRDGGPGPGVGLLEHNLALGPEDLERGCFGVDRAEEHERLLEALARWEEELDVHLVGASL
jgi:hypothetical protein